ncbi:MAG: adhesin [Bifidobacterium bifidum]|nr:adhesin [Bifidobacterium bifidum]
MVALTATVALTGGLCAGAGGMVLIRHLSAGSAGSASTMQPPSGNFGGGANTMQYDYSGIYSGALTVGEDSITVIDGTDITASSSGSNGVFATDSGTALVNGASIETTADNSRGLDATYGGTILANKITADTQGDHSAIVATDRGGGSISLADATLSTAGSGSPLLYSTGDIQVNNVSGTSSGSQIAGMEGLNTILIKDSTLESTVTGKTASDPIANGIIIYQSTSGDAEASTGEHATFQSVDSTLSSAIGSGSMFYFTNTIADVVLQNTELDFDTDAPITVNVDGTSTWVVTKDTTISALNVASGGKVVDGDGNTVTIVANGKTVVSGSGDVTVTVIGSYSTSVSAGSDTELSSDTIDRSEFDSRFGTSTAWTMA